MDDGILTWIKGTGLFLTHCLREEEKTKTNSLKRLLFRSTGTGRRDLQRTPANAYYSGNIGLYKHGVYTIIYFNVYVRLRNTRDRRNIMTAATCLPVDELRLFVLPSFLSSLSGREGRGNLETVNVDVRNEDGRQTGKPCVFGG